MKLAGYQHNTRYGDLGHLTVGLTLNVHFCDFSAVGLVEWVEWRMEGDGGGWR